jgi:quercetin dioxygenase-like cupin family protein
MSIINFLDEAKKLADKRANVRLRDRFVNADGFHIDMYVFHLPGEGRFHTCGRDEFFYVLKGEVELQVEDDIKHLRAGEGINVKAGIKHKHTAQKDTWIIVISKWPHEHVYYDTEP